MTTKQTIKTPIIVFGIGYLRKSLNQIYANKQKKQYFNDFFLKIIKNGNL